MAQLCINRFRLPVEILYIIKDFAFLSLERLRIMQAHTFIHEVIIKHADIFDDDSFYNEIYHNRDWFYWSGRYQFNQVGFYVHFCKKCGDYLPLIYPMIYRGKPPICLC